MSVGSSLDDDSADWRVGGDVDDVEALPPAVGRWPASLDAGSFAA
jgi:hypothetical protein